jgi:hypothetical protein
VQWAHLVHVADGVRVRVHVVPIDSFSGKRFWLLGVDTRKVLRYKEKNKLEQQFSSFRKQYSGSPKILLGTLVGECG